MSGTTKTSGGFYRDEAARLVSEAARVRRPDEMARTPFAVNRSYIPPVMLEEPMRPLLTPDPAYNENERSERPRRSEMRPGSSRATARLLARIALAPWFVAVAVAAVWIDLMFIKALLGF